MVGLVVPVMKNFKGFTRLMASVDHPITPYVINNWDYNSGVAKGWNAGIQWAMGEEVLIICNDDVIFHPRTIYKLTRLMYSREDIDLCSVVATDTGKQDFHQADFPDFACYAIRPESFVNKFGYFDEHFYPAYFEDNDMAYRIKVGGGIQGLCLDARIEHEGSVTQHWEGGKVVTDSMFEANRAYYKAKWGGEPHEEKYLTPHNQPHLTIKDW